jgi:cellobiose transport system permease protein
MSVTRRTPGGRRARGAPLTPRTAPYLLIAPFFVLFAIFGVFPLFYTGWVSLHDWDLISSGPHEFVGLENYRTLADDPDFRNAIVNTLGIFVLATVPQILIALGLAALLNQTLRARTFFRMGVLLPNVTSIAAVSIVFSQLFGREYGLVNYVLSLVGIDPVNWQAHKWSSWIAIATMVDWRWTGYNTLILLAAMQAIPSELYDAAKVDGATGFRAFRSVTVPMLRYTIMFVVVVATIGGIQLFAEPLLFDTSPASANGGAGREFQTIALYLYQTAFRSFDFGYAAAISWLLFLLVLLIAGLNALLVRRLGRSAR